MEEQNRTILSAFDIRKFKMKCNAPGCDKNPDFETVLFQRSSRKSRKNLASLYVCKEHVKNVQCLADMLRASNPKLITDFQKIEINKGR
jgi:hypothetical protein